MSYYRPEVSRVQGWVASLCIGAVRQQFVDRAQKALDCDRLTAQHLAFLTWLVERGEITEDLTPPNVLVDLEVTGGGLWARIYNPGGFAKHSLVVVRWRNQLLFSVGPEAGNVLSPWRATVLRRLALGPGGGDRPEVLIALGQGVDGGWWNCLAVRPIPDEYLATWARQTAAGVGVRELLPVLSSVLGVWVG